MNLSEAIANFRGLTEARRVTMSSAVKFLVDAIEEYARDWRDDLATAASAVEYKLPGGEDDAGWDDYLAGVDVAKAFKQAKRKLRIKESLDESRSEYKKLMSLLPPHLRISHGDWDAGENPASVYVKDDDPAKTTAWLKKKHVTRDKLKKMGLELP